MVIDSNYLLPTEKFELLIEVNEVMPHFPIVPADLAAVGLLLFSNKNLSNWMLEWTTVFGWLECFPLP